MLKFYKNTSITFYILYDLEYQDAKEEDFYNLENDTLKDLLFTGKSIDDYVDSRYLDRIDKLNDYGQFTNLPFTTTPAYPFASITALSDSEIRSLMCSASAWERAILFLGHV